MDLVTSETSKRKRAEQNIILAEQKVLDLDLAWIDFVSVVVCPAPFSY